MISLEGIGTLTERLARGIRRAIHAGELGPGERLPAQRTLADDLALSRNVVLAAFEALRDEGYVEARRGSGTYVRPVVPVPGPELDAKPWRFSDKSLRLSARAHRTEAAFDVARLRWAPSSYRVELDFRYGPPAFRDLPFETFCRLLGRRYRRASKSALDYAPPAGADALREALAGHLSRARGVRCDPGQVLITRGTQEAVRLAAEVLVDPGDRVVVEEPGYLAAKHLLRTHGARIVPGPVDGEGLSPTSVSLGRDAPRLVYVTPSHQFPLGAVMPLERRRALLERVAAVNAAVLEDDYDGELRHEGRPIASLQGLDGDGRVLYTGSFSKSLFPALRVGYLVVPPGLVPAFEAAKTLSDAGGNTPLQLAIADFISRGHLDRHLRRTRVANKARRTALLQAVRARMGDRAEVQGEEAGHHVVLWLREVPRTAGPRIRADARALGVGVYPIEPFYDEPPDRVGFLLGYAGLEPAEIDEGVARLSRALPGHATTR